MKKREIDELLEEDEIALLNAPQYVQNAVARIRDNTASIQAIAEKFGNLVSELGGGIESSESQLDIGKTRNKTRLGKMVSKLGTVWTRGHYTVEDAAEPMTRRILCMAKELIDVTKKAAYNSADAAWEAQTKAYDNLLKYREDSKNLLSSHVTGAASKMRSFVHERFGNMFSEDIDEIYEKVDGQIEQMIDNASSFVDSIEKIPVTPPDPSKFRDDLHDKGEAAKRSMMVDILAFAKDLVGEETARELAIEVFGVENSADVDEAFDAMPRKRGVVDGLFGAVAATMKAGGQVGGAAIDTTAGMVGSLATGLKGVAGSMLGTAAGVNSSIGNAAAGVFNSIFGNSLETKEGVKAATTGVANSIIGGAANVGQMLMNGIGSAASSAFSATGDVAKGLVDFAASALTAGKELAVGLYDSAKDMLGLSKDEAEDTMMDSEEYLEEMAAEEEAIAQAAEDSMQSESDEMEEAALGMEEEAGESDNTDEWDEYMDENAPDEPQETEDPYEEDDGSEYAAEMEAQAEAEAAAAEEAAQQQNSQETSTPMGNDDATQSGGLKLTGDTAPKLGWEGVDAEIVNGLEGMMHDGDQQLFNPYGHTTGKWTMYSFRPSDSANSWPLLAITPASFQAIRSMDKMLDNIPFIVVKEYFFKNVASTMIDFIAKISGAVKEAFTSPKQDAKGDTTAQEQSSQGTAEAKSFGKNLTDKIRNIFGEVTLKRQVIDIPFLLYAGLRQRQYGNTYILPYIANSGTVINEANNDPEWNGGGGLAEMMKKAIQGVADLLANTAATLSGSTAKNADLFPAPTWGGPKGDNHQSFSFDLILINDNIVKARNNYMCVNTIIHNNRSIQKAILAFPGALYEVWLPTGQRHLMCTGDFKLYPLGLNRKTPKDFFEGGSAPGAGFRIGTSNGDVAKLQNPTDKGHRDDIEVLPDAYKLTINFKSCLANNMNTAVFQYYVEMSGYPAAGATNDPEKPPASVSDGPGKLENGSGWSRAVEDMVVGKKTEGDTGAGGSAASSATENGSSSPKSVLRDPNATMRDLMESQEWQEKFEEATYNKRLGRLNASQGDQTMNSDGVLATVRKAQATVDDAGEFLSRLYNAPKSSLWYMPDPDEKLYTTLKPDYAKMLRDKYQKKMVELRKADDQLKSSERSLERVNGKLGSEFDMDKRRGLLSEKLALTKAVNARQVARDAIADELIQIDTDIIQRAFDEQDDVVSMRKRNVTFRVFKQAWNERILNSYEREKLQYLTSKEKEHYFKDKVRQLQKVDSHGILNHEDWFFRVVVMDYIVREMHRLILWFKNCRWDEFENIYKITRKLRMLQLDMDAALSAGSFDINHTNLFQISEQDAKDYTKIDEMLEGNSLYELFMSQMDVRKVEVLKDEDKSEPEPTPEDKEIMRDRESELEVEKQRLVRDDVVCRVWKSEEELTKAAYDEVKRDNDREIDVPGYPSIKTIGQLKDTIIQLKLGYADSSSSQLDSSSQKPDSSSSMLQDLLGALVSEVRFVKENMVAAEMGRMNALANEEIQKKDDSATAEVVR